MKQKYTISKRSLRTARKNGKLGGRPKGAKGKIKFLFIGLLTPTLTEKE